MSTVILDPTTGKSKVAVCPIVRRVLFLAHGKVMVCRVLFSGTRRSQASPCAFYLAHGRAIIFFSVYDGRYEGAAALGFAVCHEKAHGEGLASPCAF